MKTKSTPAKAKKPCPCAKQSQEKIVTCDQVLEFHVKGDRDETIADLEIAFDADFPKGTFRKELLKTVENAVCDFLGKWFAKKGKTKKSPPKTQPPKQTKPVAKKQTSKHASKKTPKK